MFRIYVLILVIFSSCTNFGQKSNPSSHTIDKEKSDQFFKEAEVYKQGSLIQLALYDSAIYYNPNNHEIYFKKSIWYKKSGRFKESFEILDRAVDLAPEFNLGYRAWSKLYFLRDYQGCIDDLERLDTLTPNFVDYPWSECIYYLIGLSYLGMDDFQQASDNFSKSIADQPDDFYSLYYKGVTSYFLGKYVMALTEFERAEEVFYELPDLHYYKALSYFKLNRIAEARKEQFECNQFFNGGYRFTLPFIQPFRTIYQNDIDELKALLN